MKKPLILLTLLLLLSPLVAVSLRAQGDRLLGTYLVEHGDVQSTVRFTRNADGRYQCQVTWVSNEPRPDGTYTLDVKNPDPSRRNVRADQVLLMENLVYDKVRDRWGQSQIYDPTSGKKYRVELSFKDSKTLVVKGMWGPFSRRIYWKKK